MKKKKSEPYKKILIAEEIVLVPFAIFPFLWLYFTFI